MKYNPSYDGFTLNDKYSLKQKKWWNFAICHKRSRIHVRTEDIRIRDRRGSVPRKCEPIPLATVCFSMHSDKFCLDSFRFQKNTNRVHLWSEYILLLSVINLVDRDFSNL